MEGAGHVFFIQHIFKCSGPPPVLFDQTLNLLFIVWGNFFYSFTYEIELFTYLRENCLHDKPLRLPSLACTRNRFDQVILILSCCKQLNKPFSIENVAFKNPSFKSLPVLFCLFFCCICWCNELTDELHVKF